MTIQTSANLTALRDELVRRLEAGDAQITEAKKTGADTTRWENHWITLLREYEQICQMLAAPMPRPFVQVAA